MIVEDEPAVSRSRLGSVVEAASGSIPARAQSPAKKAAPAPISSLARLKNPQFLDRPEEGVEPPISPVPLPPGVVCIDNFDDGNLVNGPDIIAYLRHREIHFKKSVFSGNFLNAHGPIWLDLTLEIL